jgi:lipoprotein-anchoring transpeptidase ErfK/SrfK
MQRIGLMSLALMSALAASVAASANPLSVNVNIHPQRRAPAAAMAGPSQAWSSVPARQAAPPSRPYGGGFFEWLFRGPLAIRHASPAGYPADYGPGSAAVDPRYMRQEVRYDGREPPGTIVVDTRGRMLYLVQGGGRALRYGIGVGRPGFTWSGTHHVSQKREWPDWTPPPEMLSRRPDLPRHMQGGPDNPLGARALYLGSTLYRIHGSNEPWTIGTQVSSGCIRMRNEDVIDLYSRVKVGTRVVVI